MFCTLTTNSSYEYDHLGNRVTETTGGSPTYYLWDEFSRFGDVVLETGLNGSNLEHQVDYVLVDGMLISQTNVNDDVDYFLTDAQRSTIALADDTGTVDADHNFTYNAFGELQDDPAPTSLGTKYLYTGQYFDAFNTELYNLRARYYDPSVGRFTARDKWVYNYQNPVELNRYSYSQNNPATYFDPSGYNSGESSSIFDKVIQFGSRGVSRLQTHFTSNFGQAGLSAISGYAASTPASDPQVTPAASQNVPVPTSFATPPSTYTSTSTSTYGTTPTACQNCQRLRP